VTMSVADSRAPDVTPAHIEFPPGLPAPPGLDMETLMEKASALMASPAESVCKVTIRGLPNKLLSEPMFEAVLQQAGLDSGVERFSVKPGKPVSLATVIFSSRAAAALCVAHFQGCQWDQSGVEVVATIAHSDDLCKRDLMQSGMSAEAPAFEPGRPFQPDVGIGHAAGQSMTAYPAHLLGCIEECLSEANSSGGAPNDDVQQVPVAVVPKTQVAVVVAKGILAGSGNSTEVGESECEDEKESPALRALAGPS